MRITSLTRTAKSAKAKWAIALFSALAVFGASGALLFGASAKFTVSAAPATQTVTAGQSTSFTIALQRQNKFTSPVTLSATGLPAGATKSFIPATVPGASSSSALQITTGAGTTPGTYTITITGAGGGATSSTTVKLTVVSASQPNFSLSATPRSGVISADDDTSYTVDVDRTGGFTGAVGLSVSGLPNGVSASYEPASVSSSADETTLELYSDSKPKPGNYTVVVTGTGYNGPTELNRSTSIRLVVEEKKPFEIDGAPAQQLVPGTEVPLDLSLTNAQNFTLSVTEVHVSIDPNTSNAGCDGTENYTVDQLELSSPLSLPAGATRTLSSLGVAQADLPAVRMNDSVTLNQDACKGAALYFNYSGLATK